MARHEPGLGNVWVPVDCRRLFLKELGSIETALVRQSIDLIAEWILGRNFAAQIVRGITDSRSRKVM